MTDPVAANFFSDPLRVNAEAKAGQDQMTAVVAELLGGSSPSTLTAAAGRIVPTAGVHFVDSEGQAPSDLLERIAVVNHPVGRLLLLLPADPGRVVTVVHDTLAAAEGPLLHEGLDATLGAAGTWLLLLRVGDGWQEIGRRTALGLDLAADAAAGRARLDLGATATSTANAVTLVDFAGIPSHARHISVAFSELSFSPSAKVKVQLGDGGGIETSGYASRTAFMGGSSGTEPLDTGGFVSPLQDLTDLITGRLDFELLDPATNLWAGSGLLHTETRSFFAAIAGRKALSSPLQSLRVTSLAGTSNFTGGKISLTWRSR